MDEVDYVLAQEEQEMRELIALMEDEPDNASQHYGSDDEDYDQLFMEYSSTMQPQPQSQQQNHQQQGFSDPSMSIADSDAMDMS